MGALDYAHGVYGIGDGSGKHKKNKKHYSTTQNIEDHLGC